MLEVDAKVLKVAQVTPFFICDPLDGGGDGGGDGDGSDVDVGGDEGDDDGGGDSNDLILSHNLDISPK